MLSFRRFLFFSMFVPSILQGMDNSDIPPLVDLQQLCNNPICRHNRELILANNLIEEDLVSDNNVALDEKLVKEILKDAPRPVKQIINLLKGPSDQNDDLASLLLIGKPGTGKSTLAIGIALEANLPYTLIRCPALSNEYKSSGKQNLRRRLSSMLSSTGPCVVIFDEISALANVYKDNHTSDDENLGFIDTYDELKLNNPHAYVIATTNKSDAFSEPINNRFGRFVELHLPTAEKRKSILQFHFDKRRITPTDNILRAYLKIHDITKSLCEQAILRNAKLAS